ncbi:NAD-dependent epimerase/dehydratase family protein [Pseudomonas sp. MAFF 301449]|uniref:NAD-dependent epimerase/dehydratase family protein n=1 Tax=Pseudomonas cyclaminis TaxID=2781239 RepID=A0ABR9SNB5_9PSED|nr:NAD-dependent epimerase/dehydratase family protein [Pseudomonas cyclaminis]MBE8599661.1 NAD-dependent epimerase/dehydratase family protein [Pseudomonas cyclaminis]
MPEVTLGVLGASSLVGRHVLALLEREPFTVTAFSRQEQHAAQGGAIRWRRITEGGEPEPVQPISLWICVAPIWVLPQYFALLQACGARKVIALSSTSCFTKSHSDDLQEQHLASRLRAAEVSVEDWALHHQVHWSILRPTLIYGDGRDKNIAEIARFIRRFGFFPVFGRAMGLRQPVHAEDVAMACVRAVQAPQVCHHAYNLSGGETLAYRDMVGRVFGALNRRPRLLTVPLWVFRIVVPLLRCLPRYRQWSAAMAQRMNQDLIFDHGDAARDLGFAPRAFVLSKPDLG